MPLLLFFLEIFIFIIFVNQIGFWYSVLVYLIPTILGFLVLRVQSRNFLMDVQTDGNPSKEVIKKGLTFLAAILLIFPSFFSKVFGLTLMLPFIRSILAWGFQGFLVNKVFSQTQKFSQNFGQFGNGNFKFYYKTFGDRPGGGVNSEDFINTKVEPQENDIIDASYKKIEEIQLIEDKKRD
ncbi:MAG: FxsA family protein [Bdellovibrionaceae bacterium]|nr:FxsA family protein [Pseudobdellovibrionaceae bacterium]NUM59271.1 FxsA family protein [Pseudobdellovibrionaceae bacterium]